MSPGTDWDPVEFWRKTPALKEWAAILEAIRAGRPPVLLRKGGIHERGFGVKAPRFLLFPTYLHQEAEKFRPEAREFFEPLAEIQEPPAEFEISLFAEVRGAASTEDFSRLEGLASLSIMTEEELQARYRYQPEKALSVLLLEVRPLAKPLSLEMKKAYGGCRSWLELGTFDPIDLEDPLSSKEDLKTWSAALENILEAPLKPYS